MSQKKPGSLCEYPGDRLLRHRLPLGERGRGDSRQQQGRVLGVSPRATVVEGVVHPKESDRGVAPPTTVLRGVLRVLATGEGETDLPRTNEEISDLPLKTTSIVQC